MSFWNEERSKRALDQEDDKDSLQPDVGLPHGLVPLPVQCIANRCQRSSHSLLGQTNWNFPRRSVPQLCVNSENQAVHSPVTVQDEFGERRAGGDDTQDALGSLLPGMSHSVYRMLASIDPYGDTTFNRIQMPLFLREWAAGCVFRGKNCSV